MAILPFSTLFLMALQGSIYTISVDIYAFRLAFSRILHCVLPQIALYLAANSPKCGANGGFLE